MLRLLHFSDVHVDVPFGQIPVREMLGKRLLGGANLLLRRRSHFRDARTKLAALARFADAQHVDLVVCTGDYTALGTEPELRAARVAVDALTMRPRGYITVPGNHDLYLPDTLADRRFERNFGDLLGTDWPEYATCDGWPSVRLVDEHLAVVTVNSARPNPQLLRSSGRIHDDQLLALERLFADPRLVGRSVFLATHYAPRLPDGTADRWNHGLENADALLELCAALPRVALLHGHIHWRFHLRLRAGLDVFGAGSATHAGREGIWLFEIDSAGARAIAGHFVDGEYRLKTDPTIAF